MSMPDIPDDPDQAAYNQAHPLKNPLPASQPSDYPAPTNDSLARGLAVSRAAWDVKNPTANQSQADMGSGSGTGPSAIPILNSTYGTQPQGDTTQTQKPAPGSVSPYDIEIPKNPSASALKNIASNSGFDTLRYRIGIGLILASIIAMSNIRVPCVHCSNGYRHPVLAILCKERTQVVLRTTQS